MDNSCYLMNTLKTWNLPKFDLLKGLVKIILPALALRQGRKPTWLEKNGQS